MPKIIKKVLRKFLKKHTAIIWTKNVLSGQPIVHVAVFGLAVGAMEWFGDRWRAIEVTNGRGSTQLKK